MTAICAHLLAQRGELDLDAPASNYWPEFKAEGKENIPVRQLMSHRSGLPVVDVDLTPEQVLAWDPIVDALAAQKPIWEPNTKHGYHALTYGWLVGEVIKRVSGKNIGRFFRDEIGDRARPRPLDRPARVRGAARRTADRARGDGRRADVGGRPQPRCPKRCRR